MPNPRDPFSQFNQFTSGGPAAPPGAFGTRVAPVAPIPVWNRNAAVASVAPLQPQAGGVAWQNAIDMMGGGISRGTQNYIRDRAAALGVNLGAGGADWTTNNALIGEVGTSEARAKAGLDAYNALLSGTQNLVSDPTNANTTNADIAEWNNTNAAAPDPAAAAQYQKQLFDEQIKLLSQAYRNPAGGTYGARPGSGPLSAPTWASATPPNLTAPGFASPAGGTPGLLNSGSYTNGMYTGSAGGGGVRSAAAPAYNPDNYRGGVAGPSTGYNSLDPNSGFGGYDPNFNWTPTQNSQSPLVPTPDPWNDPNFNWDQYLAGLAPIGMGGF